MANGIPGGVPRGPAAISPPTRRELAPGRAPLIFDREALRAPAHLMCRQSDFQYTVYSVSLRSV